MDLKLVEDQVTFCAFGKVSMKQKSKWINTLLERWKWFQITNTLNYTHSIITAQVRDSPEAQDLTRNTTTTNSSMPNLSRLLLSILSQSENTNPITARRPRKTPFFRYDEDEGETSSHVVYKVLVVCVSAEKPARCSDTNEAPPSGQAGLSTYAYYHLWISALIRLITQMTKEL